MTLIWPWPWSCSLPPRPCLYPDGPYYDGRAFFDDSGYGGGFWQPRGHHDGYRGGRGRGFGFDGFGRGGQRYQSTPNFGRGRGGGRHRSGDGVRDVPGTAADILGRRVAELEEQLKTVSPKYKTLEELSNIKDKYKDATNRIKDLANDIKMKDEQLKELKDIKSFLGNFKNNFEEVSEESLEDVLASCSERVKKHMKVIINGKMSGEDILDSFKIIVRKLSSADFLKQVARGD